MHLTWDLVHRAAMLERALRARVGQGRNAKKVISAEKRPLKCLPLNKRGKLILDGVHLWPNWAENSLKSMETDLLP